MTTRALHRLLWARTYRSATPDAFHVGRHGRADAGGGGINFSCKPVALGLLISIIAIMACGSSQGLRVGDHLDVSSYPKDIQASYRVFAARCSRCHSLARPLNANITDAEHWIRYVNRMRLQPGSGIGPHNADKILHFLLFYAELQKRQASFPYPNRLESMQTDMASGASQSLDADDFVVPDNDSEPAPAPAASTGAKEPSVAAPPPAADYPKEQP